MTTSMKYTLTGSKFYFQVRRANEWHPCFCILCRKHSINKGPPLVRKWYLEHKYTKCLKQLKENDFPIIFGETRMSPWLCIQFNSAIENFIRKQHNPCTMSHLASMAVIANHKKISDIKKWFCHGLMQKGYASSPMEIHKKIQRAQKGLPWPVEEQLVDIIYNNKDNDLFPHVNNARIQDMSELMSLFAGHGTRFHTRLMKDEVTIDQLAMHDIGIIEGYSEMYDEYITLHPKEEHLQGKWLQFHQIQGIEIESSSSESEGEENPDMDSENYSDETNSSDNDMESTNDNI